MNESAILAIDIGTTSVKALAVCLHGEVLAEREYGYRLYSPTMLRKEQDPEEIVHAVLTALASILRDVKKKGYAPLAVGTSCAMHSLLALAKDGTPLTRVVTWADQRALAEAESLRSSQEGFSLYQRTGTPIHPMSPLVKLIWFQKHEPQLFQRAAKWVSIKEYLLFRLFHRFVVDYSTASTSGLFHLENGAWDKGALLLAGIEAHQLSTLVPTHEVLKGMDKSIAAQYGIPPQLPFVVGATDGVLANLGSGAVGKGEVTCTVGTSGAVRTVVNKPTIDQKGRLFCYVLDENRWVIGGPINNGGIALQWLGEKIMPQLYKKWKEEGKDPYEEMTHLAAEVAPGADGLLFLPYLTGERAPYWRSDAKGVFFGLTLDHGQKHLVRAVMEGVLFQLYSVVVALKEVGVEPVSIKANGGFVRSPLWRQMMADIFETPLFIPESYQSVCFGAAQLAAQAVGAQIHFDRIMGGAAIKEVPKPDPTRAQVYREIKPLFIRLALKLLPEFQALNDVYASAAEGEKKEKNS